MRLPSNGQSSKNINSVLLADVRDEHFDYPDQMDGRFDFLKWWWKWRCRTPPLKSDLDNGIKRICTMLRKPTKTFLTSNQNVPEVPFRTVYTQLFTLRPGASVNWDSLDVFIEKKNKRTFRDSNFTCSRNHYMSDSLFQTVKLSFISL